MQRLPIRSYAAAAFFVGYLLVQLLVPAMRLAEERPSKFGWQMFSGLRSAIPEVELVFPDSTTSVRVREVIIYGRADVDYGPRLADYLCERSGAEAAILRHWRPRRELAHRCLPEPR